MIGGVRGIELVLDIVLFEVGEGEGIVELEVILDILLFFRGEGEGEEGIVGLDLEIFFCLRGEGEGIVGMVLSIGILFFEFDRCVFFCRIFIFVFLMECIGRVEFW